MLIEQTLDKLNSMKLGAMAEAVQQQLRAGDAATPLNRNSPPPVWDGGLTGGGSKRRAFGPAFDGGS